MTTITYDQLVARDPTESSLFKCAMVFDRVVAKLKLKFLIEVMRLLMLGFYEDFRCFVQATDGAEAQAEKQAQFMAVQKLKLAAAANTAKLISRLESLDGVPYKGGNLLDYILGRDRLDDLRLFVKATRVEHQAEEVLDQAKSQFLSSFAKRRLSKSQQTALLQKFNELKQVAVGNGPPISRS